MPEAEAGGCMYLVRLPGGQRPCNAPAKWQTADGRMRYCDDHGNDVEHKTKWLKKPVHLRQYP